MGKGTPAISLGERHGLILASDGSLWSWGSDFLGWPVLGLGNVTAQTRLRRIGNETNWISISAGTITMWPSNRMARFGPGERTFGQFGVARQPVDRKKMAATPLSAPLRGNDWKQAVAGGIHTVALKKDGTLWAWGNNWAGSLGTGSTNNSAVPVQVGSATNWIKVWAGMLESVALQSDGSLWYWGDNPDPAFDMHVGQILVPTRISPDTNWVDVGSGREYGLRHQIGWDAVDLGAECACLYRVQDPALDATPTRVGTNSDWADHSRLWSVVVPGADQEGRFTLAHGCFGFRR